MEIISLFLLIIPAVIILLLYFLPIMFFIFWDIFETEEKKDITVYLLFSFV